MQCKTFRGTGDKTADHEANEWFNANPDITLVSSNQSSATTKVGEDKQVVVDLTIFYKVKKARKKKKSK